MKWKKKGPNVILENLKHFTIVDGHLTFKNRRRVIFENDTKQAIIHNIHKGPIESVALSGHSTFFRDWSFLSFFLKVLKQKPDNFVF